MSVLRLLLLALVIAGGTWLVGWWAVPICGAAYAIVRRGAPGIVREAAGAAMLAWCALLAIDVAHPAFGRLAAAVGGALPVPTWLLLLVAIVFAGLLAGSSAALLRDR